MPRMSTILVLLLTFYNVALMPAGSASTSGLIYVGCFSRERTEGSGENATISTSNDSLLDLWFTPQNPIADESPQRCVYACQTDLFRYAGVMKSSKKTLECMCGSSYGRNGIGQCDNCTADASQLCGSETAASVYDTNFQVPSPPQQIVLLQRTESALRISWVKPRAPNGELLRYRIHAQPVFSHSQEPLLGKAWEVSDGSEQQQNLIGLLPGSQYNISVAAVNSHGASAPKSALLWTKIGVPDIPPAPRIIRQDRRTMTIELEAGHNTKGPISAYRIVVMDDTRANIYTLDHMVTWNESITTNHPYYVAAEFSPEDLPRRFVIGSESRIGMYFNGPLPPGHWHPTLGIVSSMEGFVETSYSISSHDQHAGIVLESNAHPERVEIIEEDEMLVKVLWVAIGVSGCILIACTVFYVGLKMNILPKRGRRRRTVSTRTENHQLTARESTSTSRYSVNDEQPEVYTHMGFIHDEDMKGKCLEKLQDVWYVPRNFMDIPSQDEQSVQLISKGKYGPVYLSNMRTNSSPVTLYSIPSSYFGPVSEDDDQANTCTTIGEDPEKLFKDLDELIRLDAHENVVKLIGRMEDQATMLFPVEYGGIPLKSLLLQYRQAEEKPNVSPYSLLLCAMNIAEGMFHLHSYQVTHGQLAACNVLISDLEKPKVTGFGLLASNPLTETLDFTRWLAVEQFQNRCVKPCDIWSFGVLLWEIATFGGQHLERLYDFIELFDAGGTPYHDIRTEDFPKRICQGARPSQTEAIGDALYQIMLYCWQLDRDERPDFSRLSCSIHELLPHSKETLFFSPNFHNPPYIHQFEHLRK